MTTQAWSINLTDPAYTKPIEDLSVFGNPLWIDSGLVVMEVQFWSAKFGCWVLVVRDTTTRALPQGYKEVAVDQLDLQAAAMLGVPPPTGR